MKKNLQEKIFQKNIAALKWLIQQGYDLNICPYDGCTPLYASVHQPNIDIMKFLLENGADPNIMSWINNYFGYGTDALGHVWKDHVNTPESEIPILDEMEKLLKKYGAQ